MDMLDTLIFFSIHSLAGLSGLSDFLIVFFGDYFIFIAIAVFLYYVWRAYRTKNYNALEQYVLAGAAALIARFGVGSSIRFFYHHPRPFVALGIPHLINDATYSFPSGHTIFMFALATATYFFNKKLAYFLYASGLIIGLARIAGGVHYPSDILGGIVLGSLTGYIVYKIWERYSRSNTKTK